MWQIDDPSRFRKITDDPALDDDPSWSADGATLFFVSERTGMPQVYRYDLSTGVTTQLTDEPTGAREPALAPNGTLFFSTILGDGYALMSRTPARVTPGAPVTERLPPISVAPVNPRESRYSPWGSLAPRYWVPLLHQVPEVADFVGIATTGADVVGRTSYAVAVAHALNAPLWEGLFSVSYSRWASARLDLGLQQFWDLGGRVNLPPLAPNQAVSERDRLATGGITFRHKRWRSDASLRFGAELSQDAFFVPDSFAVRFPNPLFAGGIATASAGYRLQPPLSISPENGVMMDATYRHRWVTNGTGWSNETRGTMRGYLGLPLPGFADWVLAGKVAAGISNGPNARNFALGGESGTTLGVPGVALGNGIRDFALRGYPRDVARFTRAVTTVAELRIPLFLIGKAVGRLPLAVDKVSFTVFGETGGGWRSETGSHSVTRYRDVGGELVLDLGLNLDTPIRVRIGGAQALTAGLGAQRGDWRGYVALGSSF
jgi:hypothetical protein